MLANLKNKYSYLTRNSKKNRLKRLEDEVSSLKKTVEKQNLLISKLIVQSYDARAYRMAAVSAYAQFRFSGRGAKYLLNVIKPKTFNEKIIWLRENFWSNCPITFYNNDKYYFKYFVSRLPIENHSVKLLNVWNNPINIDFDTLPQKFVLKRTLSGGSSEVKLVDKNRDDLEQVRTLCRKWLADKRRIPGRIIAEEMIEPDSSGCIYDYKFFTSRGKILFVKVLRMNINDPKKIRMQKFMDEDFNTLPIASFHKSIEDDIDKPQCWDDMVVFSRKVSKLFPFMRVDLFAVEDRFYIGEFTDCPMEGMDPLDLKYDRFFGRKLILPTEEEIWHYYERYYELFPELRNDPIYLKDNMSVYNIFYKNRVVKSIRELPYPTDFMVPVDKVI